MIVTRHLLSSRFGSNSAVHRAPFTTAATRKSFYVNETKSDSQTTI